MKIAYIILAHKHPRQLIRLINRLDCDGTTFVVHIDKKADKNIQQELKNFSAHKSNIYLLDSQKVYWGSFSMVSATIAALNEIFKRNLQFDYVKLLSGQDYPIKSNNQIKNFLLANQNKSLIEYFPIPSKYWEDLGEENGGMDRIRYWYSAIQKSKYNRLFRLPIIQRKFPKNFQPFGGSQWWLLSRECADYVNNFIISNPAFTLFFKNVYIPDEIFFQSIIINSPFVEKIVNSDVTYKEEWQYNAPSPENISKKDFPKLVKSPCLFARKFDLNKDVDILDLIDNKLLQI